MKTVLVLNKMDRLIVELQLSPEEAYEHIARTLEHINAIVGSFFAEQVMMCYNVLQLPEPKFTFL